MHPGAPVRRVRPLIGRRTDVLSGAAAPRDVGTPPAASRSASRSRVGGTGADRAPHRAPASGRTSRAVRHGGERGTHVHHTVQQRIDRGRAARAAAPRGTQADLPEPGPARDPVSLLEEQAADRLPELVPVRHGRMLASPFAFYRGAALLMAADLAGAPRSGLTAQLCGDAHLANFGMFGSPERRQVFDINDFDETAPGPWEWDVKRLLTSVEIAGRHRGFRPRERRAAVLAGAEAYRTATEQFAAMGNLEVWYASLGSQELLDRLDGHLGPRSVRAVERSVTKLTTRDRFQAQGRLTEVVDGERRIVHQPPLVVPIEQLLGETDLVDAAVAEVRGVLAEYPRTLTGGHERLFAQYEYVHLARKVVGVGSVGTRAWVVLLRGRDDGDPLLLQVKEAQGSVVSRSLGEDAPRHQGERVVVGQRAMQSVSDILLGWASVLGPDGVTRDVYVRQLRDWKGSVDLERVAPLGLAAYARLCGWTLAKAHARTGDRVALAAYLGHGAVIDAALADFAVAYGTATCGTSRRSALPWTRAGCPRSRGSEPSTDPEATVRRRVSFTRGSRWDAYRGTQQRPLGVSVRGALP